MSASTRDRRVRIYTYSDTGTDGVVVSTYTFSVERWARMENPSGRDLMQAEASHHAIDAVFTFADEVTVPSPGLLKYGATFYEVRSVLPRRATREWHVLAETVDVAQAGYLVAGEPV